MKNTEILVHLAEYGIISDRINMIEVTENSAKVTQAYNPRATEYLPFLRELKIFMDRNENLKEVEIIHPRIGGIRLSR